MSAAFLREAAAAMRERAEDADALTEAPWTASGMWWYPLLEIADDGRAVERPHGFHSVCDSLGSGLVSHSARQETADHIASWHPVVALSVAELLSVIAAEFEHGDHDEAWEPYEAALDLAAAYLNRPPP